VAAPPVTDQSLDALFSSISCTVLGAAQERLPRHARLSRGPEPHYRLYVCLEGAADLQVGGEPHRLAPGGVILVPPGATHQLSPTSVTPLGIYVVDFVARLHGIIDVPAFCGFHVGLMPGASRRPKLAASALAVVVHHTKRMPGYQLALHTHCIRLLDLLWKETLAARAAAGRPASHATGAGGSADAPTPARLANDVETTGAAPAHDLLRFAPAFRLVEQRFAEHVTLADLAGTAHLHPAYFSARFKRVAGMPPLHYLARFRLERARDLLVATDYSLEEIAHLTGFCDAAHLIRVFRRHEGVSPGRYRRTIAA
jgi:AraC-like DNA-binding protein